MGERIQWPGVGREGELRRTRAVEAVRDVILRDTNRMISADTGERTVLAALRSVGLTVETGDA